jgi:hypothetical protein
MRVLNSKTNDNKMLCAFCFSLRTLRFQSTKPLTNADTLIIICHTKKQTNINTSVQRKQNSIQTSVQTNRRFPSRTVSRSQRF